MYRSRSKWRVLSISTDSFFLFCCWPFPGIPVGVLSRFQGVFYGGRFSRSVDVPVECVLPGLRGTILVTGGMHLISKPVPPPELKLFK